MNKELEKILKESERYKGFTLLEKPEPFNKYFADKNYPIVQIHSAEVFEVPDGKDIIGFCGQFAWNNNKIMPLDGDSYSETMLVYGYEEFDCDEGKGIDILVGNDW